MKRVLVGLLAAAMLFCLCGCAPETPSDDLPTDTQQQETSADEALDGEDLDATPVVMPVDPDAPSEPLEQQPAEELIIPTNYTYASAKRDDLRFSFKYPSHWKDQSTELSAVFEEPVEPGTAPARLAITKKEAGQIVVTELVGMDKLTAFSKKLQENSTDYKMKRGKRFKMAGFVAFQFTYTGNFSGVDYKGYAAMAFSPKKNAFFLFHFRAPADRFNSFNNIRKTLLKSIKF